MLKTIAFIFCFGVSAYAGAQTDTCFIYVPNSLSTSGDCADCHKLRIGTDCDFSAFKFQLFDRWGNLKFETTDIQFEYEPEGLSDGTYHYRITGETGDKIPKGLSGNITILK